MRYQIITAGSTTKLADLVNEKIKEGWVVSGSMTALKLSEGYCNEYRDIQYGPSFDYCQPMIKP